MTRPAIATLIALTAVLMLTLGSISRAEIERAPEPSIVPQSWELDFNYNKPQLISVRLPGEDEVRHYWYMTYTVTNRTGDEQYFVPDFTMVTDAGDILQANRRIPPRVIAAIKSREGNSLLERPIDIVGRLLQGEDHARDSMAVWRMPDHNVRHVRIFIAGLSGEIHILDVPDSEEEIVLRKTLMLEYRLPGSGEHMTRKEFRFEEENWVMR